MKLPQTFIPNKNSEKNIEQLIKKQMYSPVTVEILLESCEKFLRMIHIDDGILFVYQKGAELAENLTYSKKDLEELTKRLIITKEEAMNLGFYLSALINKRILPGDEIILEPNNERLLLNGIGSHLDKITLIIKGDVGDYTGSDMKSRKLIIEGNVNNYAGNYMKGGTIIVNGHARFHTGNSMIAGTIIVYGRIDSIDNHWCNGKIYQGNKLIWPRR